MRSVEEACALMGAKASEVDEIVETPDGDVVTIRGFRTLIRDDGSMVHGVDEPDEYTVEELSDEDAAKIAKHVNGESKPAAKKTTGKRA